MNDNFNLRMLKLITDLAPYATLVSGYPIPVELQKLLQEAAQIDADIKARSCGVFAVLYGDNILDSSVFKTNYVPHGVDVFL